MRTLQNLGVVSSIAIASVATAQNAVEWRVADGGNGHWYQVVSATGPITWSVAKLAAEAKGAHLVTLTSAAEEARVWAIASAPAAWVVIPFVSIGPWLGGLQASNASSPADGWSWVTGEPWRYSAWLPGEPNEGCGSLSEDRLHYIALGSTPSRTWNDFAGEAACPNYVLPHSYVVEWDADCNNDGIVDYGQISAGDLVDTNSNNIPDCCEQGFDCQYQAVQWRTDEGGNGHWYQAVRPGATVTWLDARALAHSRGGQLASVTSLSEDDFVWQLASNPKNWDGSPGPWLGGRQLPGSSEPGGGWTWESGEPFAWPYWQSGPYNGCGEVNANSLHYFSPDGIAPQRIWNDFPGEQICGPYQFPKALIIEWSADCNNDGIVDYGQIRDGSLADVNGDNILDCCALPWGCDTCPADIDQSGAVGGVDLAAILNVWGTSGGKYPRADINRDGIVDGADLSQVLNAWGPCP
ncbi:MAG: hypothetical protein RLZZ116_280 [Planctomycetota bacterium]